MINLTTEELLKFAIWLEQKAEFHAAMGEVERGHEQDKCAYRRIAKHLRHSAEMSKLIEESGESEIKDKP